eukprot:CAMPEP_0194206644 /NCGR_PEP_ID=MMETSP0156-20130528/5605_1 /TAXON_ID=33649 /ORGANISM="Thalassionema nitzschioides, Strain L26-B" /LENGTH=576 /DNA_ID=CAMNT_0038933209 /DNA_START=491 /DNA_END=2222 /DNA_ORIENTATION=-
MSETIAGGYHPHPTVDGSYFTCQCKEGYIGDGWRCHDINECLEGDWPCPPVKEGGYCVDRSPDAALFPRYECGCRSGFDVWLSGEHGARVCIPEGTASTYVDDPSTEPTRTPAPTLSQAPTPSPSMAGGCNLCPSQSFCIETSAEAPGVFKSHQDDGRYIRCQCRKGYSGDGFRCIDVNECISDNSPCPSEEEGGFCVDRDPDDSQFPRYECGCLPGFETSSSDEHGATGCRMLSASPSLSVNPSISPPPTPILENRQERVFFNVNGNTVNEILEEKNLIELSFIRAYEEADPNECSCRSISNIKVAGIVTQDGFVNASNVPGSRLLQQASDLFDTTNSTGSGLFQFDFSLFFSFVFSCFLCPERFFASNDGSRRLVRGRTLDTSCRCTEWPGVSPGLFRDKFSEKLIQNGVSSIHEVLNVSGESELYNEYPSTKASNTSQSLISPEVAPDAGPTLFLTQTTQLAPITQPWSRRNQTQAPTSQTPPPLPSPIEQAPVSGTTCTGYPCGKNGHKYSYCRHSGGNFYRNMCVANIVSLGDKDIVEHANKRGKNGESFALENFQVGTADSGANQYKSKK